MDLNERKDRIFESQSGSWIYGERFTLLKESNRFKPTQPVLRAHNLGLLCVLPYVEESETVGGMRLRDMRRYSGLGFVRTWPTRIPVNSESKMADSPFRNR